MEEMYKRSRGFWKLAELFVGLESDSKLTVNAPQ